MGDTGRSADAVTEEYGERERERERERSALPESENLVELRSVSVEPSARDEALAVHREDHGLVRGEDAEAGREPGFRPEAKAAREEDVLVSTKIQGRGGSPASRLFVFFFLCLNDISYIQKMTSYIS